MKSFISISFACFLSLMTMSQTKISLKINHKLGSSAFAFNTTHTNNLGNKLNVKRLQYYLTVVSITHDGGVVTPIDKILLVDANTPLLDSLTTMTITTLEKVTIAVGVKSSLNHLDPATYPTSSPLAPKSPSMHWGWTPGYRFVAMEGKGGASSPSYLYEIHSLGDVSYFHTTITTAGVTNSSGKTIELNADYLKALHNINVSTGVLIHGETTKNKLLLANFRDLVFTSIEGNPSVGLEEEREDKVVLTVSPNPLKQGEPITIEVDKLVPNGKLLITDITGKKVKETNLSSTKIVTDELVAGTYVVSIHAKGRTYATSKIIITNK